MALFRRHRIFVRLPAVVLLVAFLFASLGLASRHPAVVHADKLAQRSLELGNSQPSATNVAYNFSFTIASTDNIGSIRMQLCANDPFIDTPCDAPAGLDLAGATLTGQTGEIGFTISGDTTANALLLTRTPHAATPGQVTYTLSGVKNPDVAGTLYARIQTYGSTDATGTNIDYGALAWSINAAIGLSTEVPPFLEFCTGSTIGGFNCGNADGNYSNFGELSSSATRSATSQMMGATNADGGYTIRMTGQTLTAGNTVIAAMPGGASQPGTSQFGVNFRQNVRPLVGEDPAGFGTANVSSGYNTADSYRFADGDIIASTVSSDDYTKLTASYIVNVPKDQPAGTYVSTITYICLANF